MWVDGTCSVRRAYSNNTGKGSTLSYVRSVSASMAHPLECTAVLVVAGVYYSYGWTGDGSDALSPAIRMSNPPGVGFDSGPTGGTWVMDCELVLSPTYPRPRPTGTPPLLSTRSCWRGAQSCPGSAKRCTVGVARGLYSDKLHVRDVRLCWPGAVPASPCMAEQLGLRNDALADARVGQSRQCDVPAPRQYDGPLCHAPPRVVDAVRLGYRQRDGVASVA